MRLTKKDREALQGIGLTMAEYLLERLARCEGDLKKIAERRMQLYDHVQSISAPPFDREAVTHSGAGDKMDRLIALIDQQDEKRTEREKARDAEAYALIDLESRLPMLQGQVVHRFYISGMTLEAISGDLKYSKGYLSRVKNEAVEELKQIPDEEIADLLPKDYRITKL